MGSELLMAENWNSELLDHKGASYWVELWVCDLLYHLRNEAVMMKFPGTTVIIYLLHAKPMITKNANYCLCHLLDTLLMSGMVNSVIYSKGKESISRRKWTWASSSRMGSSGSWLGAEKERRVERGSWEAKWDGKKSCVFSRGLVQERC